MVPNLVELPLIWLKISLFKWILETYPFCHKIIQIHFIIFLRRPSLAISFRNSGSFSWEWYSRTKIWALDMCIITIFKIIWEILVQEKSFLRKSAQHISKGKWRSSLNPYPMLPFLSLHYLHWLQIGMLLCTFLPRNCFQERTDLPFEVCHLILDCFKLLALLSKDWPLLLRQGSIRIKTGTNIFFVASQPQWAETIFLTLWRTSMYLTTVEKRVKGPNRWWQETKL